MKLRIAALALALFGAIPANAKAPAAAAPKDAPSVIALSVGGRLSSNLERRGATLYDSYQITPFLYFAFFEHRLEFLVNSLVYSDFLPWAGHDLVRARAKIASVTDRPLFKTGEPTSKRNSRVNSYELTGTLEFFLPDALRNQGELDLVYSKDIKAHSGHYLEATARGTLGKFLLREGKPLLQPQLFATLGWGDAHHNGYQYGAGAGVAGFNNISYGLMVVSPAVLDTHYPTFIFKRYDVIGAANRSGQLVADKTGGFHAEVLVTFRLLK